MIWILVGGVMHPQLHHHIKKCFSTKDVQYLSEFKNLIDGKACQLHVHFPIGIHLRIQQAKVIGFSTFSSLIIKSH